MAPRKQSAVVKKVRSSKTRSQAAHGKRQRHELVLDAVVYPRTAVERAVQAYRALATIRLESTLDHHRIQFSRIAAKAPEELLDDFANFVLIAAVNEP